VPHRFVPESPEITSALREQMEAIAERLGAGVGDATLEFVLRDGRLRHTYLKLERVVDLEALEARFDPS
jgi:hypothetical protein